MQLAVEGGGGGVAGVVGELVGDGGGWVVGRDGDGVGGVVGAVVGTCVVAGSVGGLVGGVGGRADRREIELWKIIYFLSKTSLL